MGMMKMRTIDIENIKQSIESMKLYSKQLGYELTTDDCVDIIDTGYQGEPLEGAVEDWLNTWETCRHFGRDDNE